MSKWKIVAAQLDLARQMETPDCIREFIDLIAGHHYNTLFLYLEDRVKTASYPYASASESYTTDEMRSLVSYASEKGIDVIPCVSVLGHAERFLRHQELEHFGELRDGRNGRFGVHSDMDFCPLQEELYTFLGRYLADLAEIFPSSYFHLGMDEVFNIGFCEDCSKVAGSYLGEHHLFLTSLLRCSEILRKLGKRPMIWADMLEDYAEILPEIPRDVVLVDWQYQADCSRSIAHFMTLRVTDNLTLFDKLGFDYLIAPCVSVPNIRSYTEYAEKHSPLGALLTNWECSSSHQARALPYFVYAGELWNGASDSEAKRTVVEGLFGCSDPLFLSGISALLETGFAKGGDSVSVDPCTTRWFYGLKESVRAEMEMFAAFLGTYRERVAGRLASAVLADMALALRARILNWDVRTFFVKAVEHSWHPDSDLQLQVLLNRLDGLKQERLAAWDAHRPGIVPRFPEQDVSSARSAIVDLAETLKKSSVLTVRFCSPNQYGVERCTISVRTNGEWKTIASGSFKSGAETTDTFYEKHILFDEPVAPDALRFEFNGYGGQGLAWVECRMADGTILIPSSVESAGGDVFQVENILTNDALFAYFGPQDLKIGFDARERAAEIHSVCLALKNQF